MNITYFCVCVSVSVSACVCVGARALWRVRGLSCGLTYPGCKYLCALLYFHLWPLWLHHILPHYVIKGTIFGKVIKQKIVV
jgi:hypothetical protein